LRLGCAAPLVVLLLVIAFGVYWCVSPGRQLATVDLLAAGETPALAYLYMPDLEQVEGQEGAQALLKRLAAEGLRVAAVRRRREEQRTGGGAAAGLLGALLSAERLQRWSEDAECAALLAHLAVPREVAVRWRRADQLVIAANLRRYLRPLRALAPHVAAADQALEWRRDLAPVPCLRLVGSEWLLATAEGTLLATPQADLLSVGEDCLLGVAPTSAAAPAPAGGAAADAGAAGAVIDLRAQALLDADSWHLHGRIDAAAIPAGTALDPFLSQRLLTGIFVGLRALSADAVEMRVELDATSPTSARALRPAATLILRMAVGQGRLQGLEISRRERIEGRRIVHDLEIRGLDAALRNWADAYLGGA
jgi:hypothetical protein